MRHARFATLTVMLISVTAACSGGSTPAPTVPTTVGSPAATSGGPSAAASPAAGSTVSIAHFSFQPATITVAVGTTVTWTNNDNTGHTVAADDGSFKSDTLASGATFSQTFATAGTFAYHCSIHTTMKGTVTVR